MKKIKIILICLAVLLLLAIGGYQLKKQFSNYNEQNEGNKTSSLELAKQELGCSSDDECRIFCESNHEICDKFCTEYPEACPNIKRGPDKSEIPEGAGGPMAGTECSNPILIAKMKTVIDNALINPPAKIENLNWMTKILPVNNPYPGYYYDISTAFGPAIDAIIGTTWNGQGEPPMAPGKFHYSFGYWDDTPKGKGATLGQETPDTIDFSKYKIAIFYTNYTGSQDKMISSLPSLKMSESDAKNFFYSVFKKIIYEFRPENSCEKKR